MTTDWLYFKELESQVGHYPEGHKRLEICVELDYLKADSRRRQQTAQCGNWSMAFARFDEVFTT
jgi:hypothetical protein